MRYVIIMVKMNVEKIFYLLVIICCMSCAEDSTGPSKDNYEDYVKAKDKFPVYSPDGQQIAYYHDGGPMAENESYPSGLYIIDIDGNNRSMVIAGDHFDPDWSADGKWLVFSTDGKIQKSKLDGSNLISFAGLDTLENANFYFMDWSHISQKIYFTKPFAPYAGLYSINSDFTSPQVIFSNLETGSQSELSHDGSKMIFVKGGQEFTGGTELYILDLLTKNETRLTYNDVEDRAPSWSNDDQFISWSANSHINIINVNSLEVRFLDFGNAPSWSSNGQIVYSGANSDYTKEVIYVINPDGTGKEQLTF